MSGWPVARLVKASLTVLALAAGRGAVPASAAQAQTPPAQPASPPAPPEQTPPQPPAPTPQEPQGTVVSAGPNGFEIRSADSAFRLRFRGYIHTDGRFYAGDAESRGVDTFGLRRARPILEATAYKIFDFRIMPDFAGGSAVVQDAYVEARFSRYANLRAGKQKAPLGYERLLSATELIFIERALPSGLVPNRDMGVMVYGDPARWLTYQAGFFNGVVDGSSGDTDTTDSKDLIGRVFVQPFRGTGPEHERLQTLTFSLAARRSARPPRRRSPSTGAAGN